MFIVLFIVIMHFFYCTKTKGSILQIMALLNLRHLTRQYTQNVTKALGLNRETLIDIRIQISIFPFRIILQNLSTRNNKKAMQVAYMFSNVSGIGFWYPEV